MRQLPLIPDGGAILVSVFWFGDAKGSNLCPSWLLKKSKILREQRWRQLVDTMSPSGEQELFY
jgi:hypothetical protein